MTTRVAFAFLLIFGVQANGQQGGFPATGVQARGQQQPQLVPSQENQVQLELLELEQDADKALMKEAILLLGRKGLKLSSERPTDKEAMKREVDDVDSLKAFIEEKKASIIKRSTEMKALREEPLRLRRAQAASQVVQRNAQMTKPDRQEQIERMEASQAENQLLQRQVQIYGQKLTEAIETFVNAELAAGNDETQKEKAEVAKKQYEKAKAKFVEISKQAQLEQNKFNELQQQVNMGGMGMGGGMGGMGGMR